MDITNREDLRVGDIATFAYDGHKFTGPLWERSTGTLLIGDSTVRAINGLWLAGHTFVRATRPAPSLPTEPGSVILVSECRGERVDEPVLAVLAGDGEWVTFGRMFGEHNWYLPEHIAAWTPAKVVAA